MDFGVVGFEGFLGSEISSDPVTKQQRLYGSGGCFKQERSVTVAAAAADQDDYWRSSKLSKTDSVMQRNSLMMKSNSTLFSSHGGEQQEQMLSFSSPKPAQNPNILPYFHLTSPAAYSRNTGYNSGILNSGTVLGPFTQSQWMELEHQALIYKYITANVPIPTNLLIPIRKALDSAGFSYFSDGLLRPNTLPWGAFHLGYSSNTDPEPGRCRRTDGKKWRCSRDAVADQKYCERHMNRGRHRSRKPVEGQSGHSALTSTTKPMPTVSSSVSASVVGPHGGSGLSNSFSIAQHQQLKNMQPANLSNDHSASDDLSRMFPSKENAAERTKGSPDLSMLSSSIDLKSKETLFLMSKQQNPCVESSRSEFGLLNSNSLLMPSQKSSCTISCRSFGSSQDCRSFGSSQDPADHETVSQQSIRQFMDNWPKNHSDQPTFSWPELNVQPDRTQLSISIPMAPADFMSSTSSPNNEKITLSPLRLSREFDPVQMGLGVGSVHNESNQRQANWIPVAWENSMGGPLGEVLHNTSNSASECKNSSSALNLMTDGWDISPRIGSSPTGVLQKTTFGSVSNSSAGSSPRAAAVESNKTREGVSLCNDLLASSVVQSS